MRAQALSRRAAVAACALASVACGRSASPAGAAPAASSSAAAAASAGAVASASAEPAPPVLSDAERALVAPLEVGATFPSWGERGHAWTVRAIARSRRGTLDVVAERDTELVVLSIALGQEDGPEPPARVGRYAIWYQIVRSQLTSDFAARAARGLAGVIAKHPDVEPPSGMPVFAPSAPPSNAM